MVFKAVLLLLVLTGSQGKYFHILDLPLLNLENYSLCHLCLT